MVPEVPFVLASAHVPCSHPSRHRFHDVAPVGNRRAVDDDISDDNGRRLHGVQHRVEVVAVLSVGSWQPGRQVDPALVPEVGAWIPGLGIDADQIAVAVPQKTRSSVPSVQ